MQLSKRVAIAVATIVPIMAFGVSSVGTVANAATCGSRVKSDVNGDGYADLIVGEPGRPYPGNDDEQHGGAVRVLFGTAHGVETAGDQFFDHTTTGVGGRLGGSLTTGYFNDDCFADVAATVYPAGPSPEPGSRSLLVLYGSASGLSADAYASLVIDHDTVAAPDAGNFGAAVAAGDFDGDGRDDLAVGASSSPAGGGVAVIYGSRVGLDVAEKQWITQATPGVPGHAEQVDEFGASLAAADFTGDGRADLAIGVPGEQFGTTLHHAGKVVVLPGSATGLHAGRSIHEDTPGVPGHVEWVDHFGSSLAAGDINGDHKAELAIGVPGESLGTGASRIQAAGMVVVVRFGASLAVAGAQGLTQRTAGMPGAAEDDDNFGDALAFGDFNGDGRDDLAIGTPQEDVGDLREAGIITVVYADKTTLTTSGAENLGESTANVPGSAETGDAFGHGLSVMPHVRSSADDLAVDVLWEGAGAVPRAGAVIILPGGAIGLTGFGSKLFDASMLTNGAAEGAQFGTATA